MKHALFAGCLAGAILLLSAVILLRASPQETTLPSALPPETSQNQDAESQDFNLEDTSYDDGTTILVRSGESIVEMTLGDYLEGVLIGEMPPSFAPAALEAQAVASRTFTLRQKQNPKHADADVCTDSSCCQAYCDPETARDKLGTSLSESLEKVRAAVEATDGLVLTYGGQLIEAVYFSCSGGTTEAAVAVWGGDVPYLQSVESPGEEDCARYTDTVTLDAETVAEILVAAAPDVDLSGTPKSWFGAVTYTEGGGVDTMEIGGVEFSGTQLRSLLSLRSTQFTVEVEGESVNFHTLGYGHRVGMSQYGAEAMAQAGEDYASILKHYYTGVTITDLGA